MKTCACILLFSLAATVSLSAWSDPPDPQTFMAKLVAPPKDYAEAKTRCANPKDKNMYLSRDPQDQALADDVDNQTKAWETAYGNDMKAHMAQNIAASQAAAMDPRQMMAMAQMQQSMTSKQLPPDPAALAAQLLKPSYDATQGALQVNEQDQAKSGQDWLSKYSDCASLPIGASGCQKMVERKANAESADIGKQRGPIMEKYYSDLNGNWVKYRDGVQKYLDAVKLNVPEGADPNGFQVKNLLNNNVAQRLAAVGAAAQHSAEAICPGFLYEAEQQYGGLCTGEGC